MLKKNLQTVKEYEGGQRLDHYLQRYFRKIPKSRIYRAIRKGEVRVNGGRAKSESCLAPGDVVRIPPPFVADEAPISEADELSWHFESGILFEDEQILCVHKPSGVAVHAGSGIKQGVIESIRQQREGYYELAHRLDRATSGCLLISKKPGVLKKLSEAFHDRKVKKCYHALVEGEVTREKFSIKAPLKKVHTKADEHRAVVDPVAGTPSVTIVQRLGLSEGYSTLALYPQTGRMHQLRAHCASIGHPICGDVKYGAKDAAKFRRLMLHAYSIEFTLDGQHYQFMAPSPF